jgi:hypothetical protein
MTTHPGYLNAGPARYTPELLEGATRSAFRGIITGSLGTLTARYGADPALVAEREALWEALTTFPLIGRTIRTLEDMVAKAGQDIVNQRNRTAAHLDAEEGFREWLARAEKFRGLAAYRLADARARLDGIKPDGAHLGAYGARMAANHGTLAMLVQAITTWRDAPDFADPDTLDADLAKALDNATVATDQGAVPAEEWAATLGQLAAAS